MLDKRLKILRLECEKTQEEIAKDLGISRIRYNQYETGKRTPDNEMLVQISEYFNVSIDYLLGKSNLRNPYREAQEQKTDEDIDLWLSKTDGYKELPEDDRLKIIEYAKFMLEKHKKPESK